MKIACPVSYLPGDSFERKLASLRRLGFSAVELSTTYCEGREDQILKALSQKDAIEAKRYLLESLVSVGEVGEGLGTVLTVEPLSPRDRALIACTEDGIRLCQELRSPSIRLNLDTYHMAVVREDPAKSIERALEYTAHVHFSDYLPPRDNPERPFPGDGSIDFRACAAALAQHGYSGYICVEGTVERMETIEEQLRRTVKFLQAIEAGTIR